MKVWELKKNAIHSQSSCQQKYGNLCPDSKCAYQYCLLKFCLSDPFQSHSCYLEAAASYNHFLEFNHTAH